MPGGCSFAPRLDAEADQTNILVLVELNGGNDGLNTVVPFADPNYARLRPRIAVAADQVVRLDERLGLHPGLAPLKPAWDSGEMAIVLGVGYPEPNLSHFRSIEIWDTASDSSEFLAAGWTARAVTGRNARRTADGIVLGRPYVGPLAGAGTRTIVMEGVGEFANAARRVTIPASLPANPMLAHVVATQTEVRKAGDDIYFKLQRPQPGLRAQFPRTSIGGQLSNAARLIASDVDVPAIKVSLGGFDTHTNERNTHDRLMRELGDALAAFREAMVERWLWHRVTVVTYSEFGRRVAENSGQGTDHGTAAPHFVLGKGIKGGFYGRQPRLDDLANGNLRFAVDFRSIYATLVRRWWNGDAVGVFGRRYPEVGFLG